MLGGGPPGAGDAGTVDPGTVDPGAVGAVGADVVLVEETAAEGLVFVVVVVGVLFSPPEQPATNNATAATVTLSFFIDGPFRFALSAWPTSRHESRPAQRRPQPVDRLHTPHCNPLPGITRQPDKR